MSFSPSYGERMLTALRVMCLAIVGLHLVAPLLSEADAWGLWSFTYLPPLWRWLLAIATALTCARPLASRMLRRLRRRADRFRIPPHARPRFFALLSLLSLIPFYLLRIVHTRWGDAYILVNGIAYPDPALRITATWQAPLDVWLHARLWALGNAAFGWADAWPVYRILSPLAGAVYVYGLLRLADSIGRNRTEKGLIVGLMGTLGVMQLFFGYAENYSLAAAGVLIFLWLALETLAGRRALWQPALALAITHGLHPSTIVLAPALLYVAWAWAQDEKGKGGRVWWLAVGQVAWPMAVVAGGVILLMELSGHGLATLVTTDRPGGGDARWFVPLTAVTTRWERYTMFSWAHLLDWLNMQMLTAPVTLGGLLIVGVALLAESRSVKTERVAAGREGRALAFLALCTGLYWLFTWVWNPDYGGQRDWDLFSLAAIPSTLWLARLLPRVLPDRGQLAEAGLMLTAVSAMHTMAWIYQNTLPWEWP